MQRNKKNVPESCLSGGGNMGSLMRAKDWSLTPVGPVEEWPQSLRTAVSIMLASLYPMYIAWGQEFVQFYNDAYRPILGSTKHPASLGQSTRECFAEIWHIIGWMFDKVMETGEATWREDQLLPLDRNGYLEECYFTFSYSAIRDETGGVGGVFVTVIETTQRVLGERRLKTLRELAAKTAHAKTVKEACLLSIEALKSSEADIPFAVLYEIDESLRTARRIDATIELPDSIFPPELKLDDASAKLWQFSRAIAQAEFKLHSDLERHKLPGGLWPEPAKHAVVIPINPAGAQGLRLLLMAGLSPRRAYDDDYRGFLELISKQVASAISNANAHEEEKRRAEMLAELDRAKTAFFSNVSHEFRTPLTLMLGPLEDLLSDSEMMRLPEINQRVAIVYRNSLRLLKLVNTLLDFSRIEAGRIEAVFEKTDIAVFTAELASSFRSLVESSGLQLVIDCSSVTDPVYVDREMWEKIVLNLISNAFKFTFEGEIRISIKQIRDAVVMEVKDTGTGIPEDQLPKIFERFHTVQGARARTYEGSGIGLTLVEELVKFHSGKITVESKVDEGTVFRIEIPTGKTHLPADRIGAARTLASTGIRSESYIEEARRWIVDAPVAMESDQAVMKAHILLADDNADMRAYLKRILEFHWKVTAVCDGKTALEVMREGKIDLVLTDIMMPNLDGFELLREIRNDRSFSDVPVIFLSARAGEEAKVEGFEAGADDYLIKPFSSRELVARVRGHLEIARLRREASLRERAAQEERNARSLAIEKDARKKAEIANRIKDEFLATLSHEVRTPLTAILGWVRMLKNHALDQETTQHAFETIERNLKLQEKLIEDLLDISRVMLGKVLLDVSNIDLVNTVQWVIETLLPTAQTKGIKIIPNFQTDSAVVAGDSERLQQIISNLLSNAIKFSPANGSVEVQVERIGSEVEVRIQDHGIGINPEFLPHVYDRFTQGVHYKKTSYGGLGLGLAIVRQLVELHDGTVKAYSEGQGKGATFSFRLPLVHEKAVALQGPSQFSYSAHPLKALRILLVEDDPDTKEMIAALLRFAGAVVTIAESAQEALEKLTATQFDLMISDIGMPEMDGLELIRIVRSQMSAYSRIPAIALTAYAKGGDRKQILSSGFQEYLSKPVEPEMLVSSIVQLVSKMNHPETAAP